MLRCTFPSNPLFDVRRGVYLSLERKTQAGASFAMRCEWTLKCTALVLITVACMAFVAFLCASAPSKLSFAGYLAEYSLFALVDLSIGPGGESRRCIAWVFGIAVLGCVRETGPVGAALSKILCFLFIDYIMPRDAFDRRRSAPSLMFGSLYYLSATADMCAIYEFRTTGQIARILFYGVFLVGSYFVSKHFLHTGSPTTSDLILLTGITFSGCQSEFIRIGSLPVDPVISSVLIMLLRRPIMKLIVPVAKKCYDHRWHLAVFVAVVPMELSPALLFLDAPIQSGKFWLLVVGQEGNAMLRNLGVYYKLYCNTATRLGRPISADSICEAEQRRRVLAPWENLVNVLVPIIISVYVVLTVPDVRSLIAMSIAFAIRVCFTCIELSIECRRATPGLPTPLSEAVANIAIGADSDVAVLLMSMFVFHCAMLVMYRCA